jgi:hypothetical protein
LLVSRGASKVGRELASDRPSEGLVDRAATAGVAKVSAQSASAQRPRPI